MKTTIEYLPETCVLTYKGATYVRFSEQNWYEIYGILGDGSLEPDFDWEELEIAYLEEKNNLEQKAITDMGSNY